MLDDPPRWSALFAGGEEQVFPVHDRGLRAQVVAAGEVGEVAVERGGSLQVLADAPVGGDGGAVVGLEVVAEFLGAGELVDADGLALGCHIGDLLAEQRADVVFAAPERRRLGAGRRRRSVGLHGGDNLADEAFWGPAEEADGPAWAAYPDQFAAAGLVVRGGHDPNTGH